MFVFRLLLTVFFTQLVALHALAQHDQQIDVLEYDISLGLTTDLKGLEGQTWVTLTAPGTRQDVNAPIPLKLDSVYDIKRTMVANTKGNTLKSVQMEREGQYLVFKNVPLRSTDTLRIMVHYAGVPNEPARFGGVYFGDEGYIYNLGVRIGVSEPSDGHSWFPAHDVFTDKATFKYRIHTPDGRMGVANGMLTDVVHHNTGKRNEINTYHRELREPIPPYLASFAIGDYVAVRDTVELLTVGGVVQPVPV
ncbi:MAG: hypothetical protein ACOCZ8_06510, partial [Bacteroidota bacterium]